MKKILVYMILFQFAIIFMGCEKEIMSYEGKEGVYFGVRHGSPNSDQNKWPYQPYSNVEFIQIKKDVVEFPVKVDISGPVKNYDRSFRVEVNPDSTTAILGKHYEAVQEFWTVRAGSSTATITVKIMRTPDLEDENKTLGLRLLPTKDFVLSFPEWNAIPALNGGTIVAKFDASLHTLRINDFMVTPGLWLGSLQAGNKEGGAFGIFTRKKMEFLTEYLGLTYEDFASSETMPLARVALIGADAAAILIERFNAKNPVLEADGRLMFFGSVPWTSIVGVPYVPTP
ncbi:DUF4843 domain-containing protein [Pedobacter sp.]|uniref:DUF4843 domain-containing protein n=1 Tax=Pedobacter sp. TaxID=1411316 RepID=UPI003D7F24AB